LDIQKAADAAHVEDEGQVVHLHGPDGTPLYYTDGEEQKPVTITVAGTYSKRYRVGMNRNRDRMVKMRRAKVTGTMVEEQQIALIAHCILAWDGLFVGEKPVPLNEENAATLLTTVPWIREQVEEAMADHEAFFGNS
jgi:hypothetical protein